MLGRRVDRVRALPRVRVRRQEPPPLGRRPVLAPLRENRARLRGAHLARLLLRRQLRLRREQRPRQRQRRRDRPAVGPAPRYLRQRPPGALRPGHRRQVLPRRRHPRDVLVRRHHAIVVRRHRSVPSNDRARVGRREFGRRRRRRRRGRRGRRRRCSRRRRGADTAGGHPRIRRQRGGRRRRSRRRRRDQRRRRLGRRRRSQRPDRLHRPLAQRPVPPGVHARRRRVAQAVGRRQGKGRQVVRGSAGIAVLRLRRVRRRGRDIVRGVRVGGRVGDGVGSARWGGGAEDPRIGRGVDERRRQ